MPFPVARSIVCHEKRTSYCGTQFLQMGSDPNNGIQNVERHGVGNVMSLCSPRPRKRGNAPRVATPFGLASEATLHGWRPLSASQARQRSTGGDPFGLASEATLHGWRPLRPRKRGNAPRVATPSASQARQRSTGGDPFGLASEGALHKSR